MVDPTPVQPIAGTSNGTENNSKRHSLRSTSSFCDEVFLEEMLLEVAGGQPETIGGHDSKHTIIGDGTGNISLSCGMVDVFMDSDKGTNKLEFI